MHQHGLDYFGLGGWQCGSDLENISKYCALMTSLTLVEARVLTASLKPISCKKRQRQRHGTWYSATYRWAVVLYNLESGIWLALAIVLRHKLAAPIARTMDFGRAVMQLPARCTMPQSATLGRNSVIHVPNYMEYYSFTDPSHTHMHTHTFIGLLYCKLSLQIMLHKWHNSISNSTKFFQAKHM